MPQNALMRSSVMAMRRTLQNGQAERPRHRARKVEYAVMNPHDDANDERALLVPNRSQPEPTTLCSGWPLGSVRLVGAVP